MRKHVDVFVGATVRIGRNTVTYLENDAGKRTLRIEGPDANSSKRLNDGILPKRKQKGRLVEKVPGVISVRIPTQNIAKLSRTG